MAVEALPRSNARSEGWSAAGWDTSLSKLAHPSPIVQSFGWGEAQRQLGQRIVRVRLASGLASVRIAGLGPLRYAEVAGGPVPATLQAVDDLTAWARSQRMARIRISPEGPLPRTELAARGFAHIGSADTGFTLVKEAVPADRLLASLESRTRSRVRRALENGLSFECGQEPEVIAELTAATAARQRIYVPGPDFYRALMQNLPWCRTYIARWGGKALAGGLIAHHDGRAVYLFAGSSTEHRELMPMYGVLWNAIRDAFEAGCTDFDFWGIPPNGDISHPMHGLWEFKTGFGGRVVERGGVWECVLSGWRDAASRTEHSLRTRVRELRDRVRGHAR